MANPALITWLLAAAWPIAKKVLVMLGIGWLTYSSVTTLAQSVVTHAQNNWSAMTGATLQICTLGGIPDMMGIITGALVARASYMAADRLGKLATK